MTNGSTGGKLDLGDIESQVEQRVETEAGWDTACIQDGQGLVVIVDQYFNSDIQALYTICV